MAQNIQILAGEKTYLHGSYSRPVEDSTVDRDTLLIIMLHSFPGNKNGPEKLYLDLEFLLRDKGYHTFRFDFRGCGESEGQEEDFMIATACEDFKSVTHWAKQQNYTRFIVVGEGIGATVALLNASPDIACHVLLWPALNLAEAVTQNFNGNTLDETAIKRGYTMVNDTRVGLSLLREMKKISLKHAIKEIQNPVLVMHGAKDTIAPIEHLDLLRADITAKRVEITSFHDGVHGLPALNHRKTMYYHITQFIEKYA